MKRFDRFPTSLESTSERRGMRGAFAFIGTLAPGDKLIAAVLGIALVATCLVGLRALQKSFLVRVPAEGGSLTEGVVGNPRFVNPLLALTDADRDLTALTYAGLMGIGADGLLEPRLAESYAVSEDGRTYTFVIRADATFSDGSSVTSEDVVFTVEKAQDPDLKSPEYANWANIRAEVVDARTVRFILPQPYAPFLEDTTLGILPARHWRDVSNDQFPFSPLMERPVGAGPFAVTRVVRDRDGVIKEYRLEAFEGFTAGRPFLDRITLRFYSNADDLAAALRRGAVESAYGFKRAGALRAPYARMFGVFYNPAEYTDFGDDGVREALSLAIDRTRIVNEVLGGYGTPSLGPVPPGIGIESPTPPDPSGRMTQARAALADAGWKFAEGVGWEKAGRVLPGITLKTSSVPELKTIASLVKEDWEALGIPVTVELYDSGSLTRDVIRPRAYQALLFGEVIGRDRDLFAFWDSGQVADPGLNIAGYANPTVDELLARARTENDPAQALIDIQAASNLIAGDFPAAFTHAPDFLYAVPNDLDGIVLPQIASPSDRFATVYGWHRHSEYIWPFLAR
ncbi:MAG TPA: peptide ABC transporter substrate-binding protein [Candidatus Paceibacterota bacterium]|nr:peptide ABC transporter substrate-binding protein [Candidatus Paceibacterota bacterium]